MNLTDREWKEFNFVEIFIIRGGFYNKKPPVESYGNIPFLGAVDNNNGITEFYTLNNIAENSKIGYGKNEPLSQKIYPGNCICVTNNGSVGYAYYQKHIFTCSHDINPLYLKNTELTENLAMFLISAIEQQKICFKYSRKWRPKRMKKSKILLPVDEKNSPDYKFMEDYIKEKILKRRQEYIEYAKNKLKQIKFENISSLKDKKWKEFFVVDIFPSIQRGKRLIKDNQISGNVPYVSSTAMNNGVDNFIQYDSKKMRKFKNCLSVANSGSVGSSFYEPFEYIASDHVTHLKNDKFNQYIYFFIATMTNRWSQKYNFNREINDPRISREKILLPVNSNDEPDYIYMEKYIKNIFYKKYSDYLEYVKKAV